MSRPSAQEIEDLRNQQKIEDAYMQSLTTTEPTDGKPAVSTKPAAPVKPKPKPKKKEEAPKAMKKGGSVRGVGIAQRGLGCGGRVKMR